MTAARVSILAIVISAAACGNDNIFTSNSDNAVRSAEGFDPYVEVYATTDDIKLESPYWSFPFRVRLLNADKEPISDWRELDYEVLHWEGVTAGTSFWVQYQLRLSGEKTQHGLLAIRTSELKPAGYLRTTSVLGNETLPVYLSSPVTHVTVALSPATAPAEILGSWTFTNVEDHYVSRIASSNGVNWPSPGVIGLPNLKTGYYFVTFSSIHGKTHFPFIVRPAKPGTHGLAVIASTNTWNAYNNWGNASFYVNAVGGPLLLWSAFDRPLAPNVAQGGHLVGGEVELIRWLEAQGIQYDAYTDADVDAGRLGNAYDTWIFHVHSEYWTKSASHEYSLHMEAGKRTIFLSGNNLWWMVSYIDDGRRMFKNGAHTNRRAADYTGTLYTGAGLHTTAPFRCVAPDHWVFEGTGLKEGSLFGIDGKFGGASGHETDKILGPSDRVTVLAHGENENDGGADMVIAKVLNGEIFNTGSITFNGALATDPAVSRILRNVIKRYNGQ